MQWSVRRNLSFQVYKIPPYIPTTMTFDHTTSLCDKDFQNLVGWGFNVIRLVSKGCVRMGVGAVCSEMFGGVELWL